MQDLLGTPREQLGPWLASIGVPPVHAAKLFGGLHRQQRELHELETLGGHRARVAAAAITHVARLIDAQLADDGTEKLAMELADGAVIEAVLVPMPRQRTTICVSTQVGCAMACAFCATGTLGLTRSLEAGEIVAQVHTAVRRAREAGRTVTRLVFMGMGEPLHHWPATRDALRVLLDGHGLGFATEKITVSTVGLPDRMQVFADTFEGKVQLALSLHAGTDATRARIIPMARKVPLATLRDLLERWPLPGSRALMLEYVVLPGVNDTDAELEGVAAFTRGLRAVLNLIPFNPFQGAGFRSPTVDEVRAAAAKLRALGVITSVRWPRGRDAHGACGQLALVHAPDAPRRRAAPGPETA